MDDLPLVSTDQCDGVCCETSIQLACSSSSFDSIDEVVDNYSVVDAVVDASSFYGVVDDDGVDGDIVDDNSSLNSTTNGRTPRRYPSRVRTRTQFFHDEYSRYY